MLPTHTRSTFTTCRFFCFRLRLSIWSFLFLAALSGLSLFLVFPTTAVASVPSGVSGELKKWHKVTVTFDGPSTSETATPNPFRDYRLNVTFTHADTGKQYLVPGYYAADGNAANTSATSGNKWRVHFAPDEEGTWIYVASFRTGSDIAISDDQTVGTAVAFDGMSGTFDISPTDKTGRDFRGKGLLEYVGEHYLQFAETGEYFIKSGAGDPEDFLGQPDFDDTYRGPNADHNHKGRPLKEYKPHRGDWRTGDPSWQGGKGKNAIGVINYFSDKGVNSFYLVNFQHNSTDDLWPWMEYDEYDRYDCSKLDQWEIIFAHMKKRGVLLHYFIQDRFNQTILDGGALGPIRKLYFREIIARFSHHLALIWNLGEESERSAPQHKAYSSYFKDHDPYQHAVKVHSLWRVKDHAITFKPLLGYNDFDGPSLQNGGNSQVIEWIESSAAAGHKWVVSYGEQGQGDEPEPDDQDFWHDRQRSKIWEMYLGGAAGVEWTIWNAFSGYLEDMRKFDHLWDLSRYAREFFEQYLPFWEMKHNNGLVSSGKYCFAKPGEIYAIYLPDGGTTNLALGSNTASFTVDWYNPRTGGGLRKGTVTSVTGPGWVSIGTPPQDTSQDWVALVEVSDLANQTPVADAEPNQIVVVEGKAVMFDGTASYDPDDDLLTYHWDFGNGITVTGPVVTHTYSTSGTYIVTLMVDDGELSNSDTAQIIVASESSPACGFLNLARCATASASSVWSASYAAARTTDDNGSTRWNSASGETAGAWLALEFDAPTTFDTIVLKEAFTRITGYRLQAWTGTSWQDLVKGTRIGTSQTHTFAPLTAQRVRLLVTSTVSRTDTGTPTIYEFEVYQTGSVPAANPPPVADAGPAQTVTVGAPVTLNGTGSGDPEGDPLTHSWDFDDGTTAAGSVVTHTYAAAGSYLVTLTVDDGELPATDTVLITVTAEASPTCDFANLAHCATASASSVWSSGYTAAKANDGHGSTRWNSAKGNQAGAWLVLEFDAPTTLDTIVLTEHLNRITGYVLQYWDGAAWQDTGSGTTIGAGRTHTFAARTTRKVRVLITDLISGPSWVTPTLYEFEVYNNGS